MEFKSLTNIESSFRRIRLMLAVFVGCCTLVTVFALWNSYRFAEKQREKIYVLDGGLDGGKSLMLALSQDLSQNRPAEAREHVRRFHELFFGLSPQKDDRRMPSSTISTVPCSWRTKAPIITMWILPRKDIITVSFPATSTRWYGWTAWSATFPATPTGPGRMPAR